MGVYKIYNILGWGKLVKKRIPFRKGENWDITFIDGREAVTIFIPNNYTFSFFVREPFPLGGCVR